MSTSIFCTASSSQTDTLISNLRLAGFSGDDISVLMADKKSTRDLAIEHNTKVPEGVAAGTGTGAAVGGTLGWLTGIGALAIPGLGPFIAAGPIMAALSGAAIGGAVGGVTGALVGMGIPEFEAKQYEGKVKAGSSLISVHCEDNDEVRRAKDVLQQGGAKDVTSSGESAVAGGRRS